MKTPVDFFHFFLGSWSIVREFGVQGTATGIANFTLLTSSLMAYREDLSVQIPGFSDNVYKEYLYSIEDGHLCKKFTDNRLFYKLLFKERAAEGAHGCGQDTYDALYTFIDNTTAILSYTVKGPQKDYKIITEFKKL